MSGSMLESTYVPPFTEGTSFRLKTYCSRWNCCGCSRTGTREYYVHTKSCMAGIKIPRNTVFQSSHPGPLRSALGALRYPWIWAFGIPMKTVQLSIPSVAVVEETKRHLRQGPRDRDPNVLRMPQKLQHTPD